MIIGEKGSHSEILTRHPKEIKLSEIIDVAEDSLNPIECFDNPNISNRFDSCVTLKILTEIGKNAMK